MRARDLEPLPVHQCANHCEVEHLTFEQAAMRDRLNELLAIMQAHEDCHTEKSA